MGNINNDSMELRRKFEMYWKTQLHGWLGHRRHVASPEIGDVILRLHQFSQLVQEDTFERAAGKVLGGVEISGTVPELQEKLANRLSRGLRGIERKLVEKSIQETFLCTTGVQCDLPLSVFGSKFGGFLRRRGSKGFIWLFLRFLLFNEISMRLHVALHRRAPDVPALEAALDEIDRLCLSAVNKSLDERSKWPKLNRELAGNLIHALESQIGRMAHDSAA